MFVSPPTDRHSVRTTLLTAALLMLLLPGVLQARGRSDGPDGGMPQVLAYLQELRDEVGALRGELGEISERLDSLEHGPLTANTRFCFETDTTVGLSGALGVGTSHGLSLARGTDAYGNASLATRDTTAKRVIEARQGSAARGTFVVCVNGGLMPMGRPLTAQEEALVQEMEAVANSLRANLNTIVAASNVAPATLDSGVQLLLDDTLGFDDPNGAIGNAQFASMAPALAGPSTIRMVFEHPDSLLGSSAQVQDLCGWAGSLSGSLNTQLAAGVSSRCADSSGTVMADSLQNLNAGVQALQGTTQSLFGFATGTVQPTLNTIKDNVGRIDGAVDDICSVLSC